jgi:hypothetical protein
MNIKHKTPIMGEAATMSGHRPMAEAEKRPERARRRRTEPGGYIASAAVADAMFDQLEHLTSHSVRGCPGDCADCARLAQVKNLLLLPFLSEIPEWIHRGIDKVERSSIGN